MTTTTTMKQERLKTSIWFYTIGLFAATTSSATEAFQISHGIRHRQELCNKLVNGDFDGIWSIRKQRKNVCGSFHVYDTSIIPKTRRRSTRRYLSEITKTTETDNDSTSTSTSVAAIEVAVSQLKKVLEREYLSFFNPMETEWYSPQVTFEDPLTSLAGVDAYQKNVDMLSGRNLMGNVLFGNNGDARIGLHTISGGNVYQNSTDGSICISDIQTRWTLQFTFQALPWKPVPQFSGISIYKVIVATGSESTTSTKVQIVRQDDYWDSINLINDGTGQNYVKVDKAIALKHFASLTAPNSFEAKAAGAELPFQSLRFGRISNDKKPIQGQYEVRKYPQYIGIQIPSYTRRDEAFTLLGALTEGMYP
jgi:Uncharacterized conserved protein (DUF2358)